MSEDNTAQQCDEIEAVSAIYGDDFQVVDQYRREYSISICVASLVVLLQVRLPDEYPSQSAPHYELVAAWLRGEQRSKLRECLDQVYLEHVGECVLYIWAERVREFLQDLVDQDAQVEETIKEFEQTNLLNKPSAGDDESCQSSDEGCPSITSGDLIIDRKSVFQPHLARVTDVRQVPLVLSRLKQNRKIATATHNIYAYRIVLPDAVMAQDCEDDGETKAGSRMLHLMVVLDVVNVVVVVTRWYGGCHIGPDRFKHINAATRSILEICGFLDDAQGSSKKKQISTRKTK